MPLARRLPKRGFVRNRTEYAVINLSAFEKFRRIGRHRYRLLKANGKVKKDSRSSEDFERESCQRHLLFAHTSSAVRRPEGNGRWRGGELVESKADKP